LIGTAAAERGADAAALVAAVFAWAANRLVAWLADAQVVRTWHIGCDAYTPALRATGCPSKAKDGRAGVHVDGNTDAGAIGSALGGIAAIAWVVNTHEAVRARYAGDAAAHPSLRTELACAALP